MNKLYEILGLPLGASNKQIKDAYRKMASRHHPDVGGDENKFKEISTAYEILSGKRSMSRSERQKYAPPTPPPPPPPKPNFYRPPKPRRTKIVKYEYEKFSKCSSCKGMGKVIEYCEKCKGTKNTVGMTDDKDINIRSCNVCPPQGYFIRFICEECEGKGKISEGIYRGERVEFI